MNGEIIVTNHDMNSTINSITVYGITDSDNAIPKRTITGSHTNLLSPDALAVDTINNEIFVANYDNNSITVYGREDTNDIAPKRNISGASYNLSFPYGIAVDNVNNEIFMTNIKNNSIVVYGKTDTGDAVPKESSPEIIPAFHIHRV